jgi:hypothetical protein
VSYLLLRGLARYAVQMHIDAFRAGPHYKY